MQYLYEDITSVNPTKLNYEILGSGIQKELLGINYEQSDQELYINFGSELSLEEKGILDYIVVHHVTSFPILDFNMELFFHRFAETFDVLERLEFSRLAPSFTAELQFFNFTEIKQLRDYLVAEGHLTQINANKITSLFAEQNIDLDAF
jgi:hypothetical protein